MKWIERRAGSAYFCDEAGADWTPVGHNDAITWPELAGLFRRRDLAAVERHLLWLRDHGVNCIRLMLEYCQSEHRYLERPAGRFMPNMVRLWDDVLALCEKVGMWVLLTPYDTFFMWIRWKHHPYNRRHGGPCDSRRRWLTCPRMREAVKARLAFASDRWGASPAIFAWDLWNELHPAHGGDDVATMAPFISDLGPWLRQREIVTHGRAHLQTVSIFGPELLKHPDSCEPIFRHPALDFASVHLYEHGTIDDPRDTVAPALATGRLIRAALAETNDDRPVLDTEHGPIHRFKDRRRTLPEPFDDEYFRHMQWAHFASGGSGGGMRWPNRHPHVLTAGMRKAQAGLAQFVPLIDWSTFRRRNVNEELLVEETGIARFGCADQRQAVVWLLATDRLTRDRRVATGVPRTTNLVVPGLASGNYEMVAIDTLRGVELTRSQLSSDGRALRAQVRFETDVALAIRPSRPA